MSIPIYANKIVFAQKLGSSKVEERQKAFEYLKNTLQEEALDQPQYEMIWKALFYTLWLADKVPFQRELSTNIAALINEVKGHGPEPLTRWLQSAWNIFHMEWPKLERNRMNKFHFLIRAFLTDVYTYLAETSLNEEAVKQWNETLASHVLNETEHTISDGLKLHVIKVTVEILTQLEDFLPEKGLQQLLEPYLKCLAYTIKNSVRKSVGQEMFEDLAKAIEEGHFKSEDFNAFNELVLSYAIKKDIKQNNRQILYDIYDMIKKATFKVENPGEEPEASQPHEVIPKKTKQEKKREKKLKAKEEREAAKKAAKKGNVEEEEEFDDGEEEEEEMVPEPPKTKKQKKQEAKLQKQQEAKAKKEQELPQNLKKRKQRVVEEDEDDEVDEMDVEKDFEIPEIEEGEDEEEEGYSDEMEGQGDDDDYGEEDNGEESNWQAQEESDLMTYQDLLSNASPSYLKLMKKMYPEMPEYYFQTPAQRKKYFKKLFEKYKKSLEAAKLPEKRQPKSVQINTKKNEVFVFNKFEKVSTSKDAPHAKNGAEDNEEGENGSIETEITEDMEEIPIAQLKNLNKKQKNQFKQQQQQPQGKKKQQNQAAQQQGKMGKGNKQKNQQGQLNNKKKKKMK